MKRLATEITFFLNRVIFGLLFMPGILWTVNELYARYAPGTSTKALTDYYLEFYSYLDSPLTWLWILTPYFLFMVVRPRDYGKYRHARVSLHQAASKGRSDTVKSLIEEGLDVNEVNLRSQTPLHLAALTDNVEMVHTLVNGGADIDITDPVKGFRPLHNAAANGCVHVCEYLLKHGADMDAQTLQGDTALHLAAAHNHPAVVSLLLSYHADHETENHAGQTAEQVAAAKGHSGIVEQIQQHVSNEWRYPRMASRKAS